MKTILHILTGVLINSFLMAQSYQPLVIENVTWIINFSDDDFTIQDYYAYRIDGDTIYQDKAYKKLHYIELSDEQEGPYQVEYQQLAGFIREDTSEQKVFAVIFRPDRFFNDQCILEQGEGPLPQEL